VLCLCFCLRHLQAAELRGLLCPHHAPRGAGLERCHQAHLCLRAVRAVIATGCAGHRAEVGTVDGQRVDRRARLHVQLLVPAHGEVRTELVERLLGGDERNRATRRGRGGSGGPLRGRHHPLVDAVVLGEYDGLLDLLDLLDLGRGREVHTDDAEVLLRDRILDRPVRGVVEALQEAVLGDVGVVHRLVEVDGARIAPVVKLRAVEADGVTICAICTAPQRNNIVGEVVPDVLPPRKLRELHPPVRLRGLGAILGVAAGLERARCLRIEDQIPPQVLAGVHRGVQGGGKEDRCVNGGHLERKEVLRKKERKYWEVTSGMFVLLLVTR
jgi:hypothetical protein